MSMIDHPAAKIFISLTYITNVCNSKSISNSLANICNHHQRPVDYGDEVFK